MQPEHMRREFAVRPEHDQERVVREVHAALEHEPRINLHRHPVKIEWSESCRARVRLTAGLID